MSARRHVAALSALALALVTVTQTHCLGHTCSDECRRTFDDCVAHPPKGSSPNECAVAEQACVARCTD